jgi:hypothetical protein
MQHLAATNVDTDVIRSSPVAISVEEDCVTDLKVIPVDSLALTDLVIGYSGDVDTELGEALLE